MSPSTINVIIDGSGTAASRGICQTNIGSRTSGMPEVGAPHVVIVLRISGAQPLAPHHVVSGINDAVFVVVTQ